MRIGWVAALTLAVLGCGPTPPPPRQPLAPDPQPPAPVAAAAQPDPTAVAHASPPVVEQPKLEPCAVHAAPSEVPFLKGQVHVHTERSFDAATPVPEVVRFFAERGYDFLSVTDHNHITIPKEHASGILIIPGVELTYNATQCDPPPRPGYLCAFHAGVLFLNPLRDATRGRHFNLPFRKNRLEVFNILMRRSDDLEGMFVLNHPTYHYAVNAELLEKLSAKGVRFVELFNGGVIDRGRNGPEAEIEKSEALWDAVLTRGHHILAVGGDDAHHFSDAATVRMQGKKPLLGDRSWIMVRAEREAGAIRRAMEEGDFYVSTGVTLSNLVVSPSHVHVKVEPKEGERFVTRFVGSGGHILARVEGTEACYPIEGTEGYVRAVVESGGGAYAWTQPVMVEP